MDIIQTMRERRSINFFEPNIPISDAVLRQLLEIANLSPSSFNLQPWRVVVVRNPDKKKILRNCALNQPKVEDASAVFIMIADPSGVELNGDRMLESWVELGYIKNVEQTEMYRNIMKQLYGDVDSLKRKYFAVKNTGLFAMNIMLAAKGLGLETHPMDGFDEACIKREFNIPEDKIIPMIIAVGYLKKGITLLPRAFRRPIDEFVNFNY